MEREASGQGGCRGLILPLFVLDVRHRTGDRSRPLISDFLARLVWHRRPLTSVLWLGPPVRLGLIVGSLDVVANFDVRTGASPFRSG